MFLNLKVVGGEHAVNDMGRRKRTRLLLPLAMTGRLKTRTHMVNLN